MSPAAPESSCRLFTYTPLPDTDTTGEQAPSHIRLIEVHDCTPDDPAIRVSIHVTSVDDAPSYQAVSYTWGDESNPEHIHVRHASSLAREAFGSSASHDGLMTVRKNCADVLRQIRHFKTSRYYWIDAICIDQQNVPEKNLQVGRMGATFKQAGCVLACIGMHDQASQLVVSMFESFHTHLSCASTSLGALTQYPQLNSENRLDQKSHTDAKTAEDLWTQRVVCEESCCEWVHGIDDRAFFGFLKAMKELAMRPYFWRIWTLQELWVTHKIQFFCGFDKLPLSTLLFWWGDWRYILNTVTDTRSLSASIYTKLENYKTDFPTFGSLDSGLGHEYEVILSQRQDGLREASASTTRQLNLETLLAICRKRQCQDRRDIVYGTLTIADWTSVEVEMPDGSCFTNEDERAPISPDYNLPAFELAKSLMLRFDEYFAIERMCEILHIGPETEEIQQGVALRSEPWPQILVSASKDQRHWSKYSGSLTRIKTDCYRLGSDARFKLEDTSEDAKTCTRIIENTGQGDESKCVAIACGIARDGDWLIEVEWSACELLVSRECEGLLFVIGKAFTRSRLHANWQETSVWLDAEDAVVLLCGSRLPRPTYGDDDFFEDNMERVSAFVNNRVCREWGSSFAIPPHESDFDEDEYKSD